MPNYCDIDVNISGTKRAIRRFNELISAYYHYDDTEYKITTETESGEEIPCERHIGYRVWDWDSNFDEFEDAEEDEIIDVYGYANVAWSASKTLFTGEYSYYTDCHKEHIAKYGKDPALTLPQAAKMLGLEIELFSSEIGCAFAEHYRINSQGKILLHAETTYLEVFIDEADTYEEYKAQLEEGEEASISEEEFNEAFKRGDSCIRLCKWLDEEGNWKFS